MRADIDVDPCLQDEIPQPRRYSTLASEAHGPGRRSNKDIAGNMVHFETAPEETPERHAMPGETEISTEVNRPSKMRRKPGIAVVPAVWSPMRVTSGGRSRRGDAQNPFRIRNVKKNK
jgi:hypothetical protein